MMQKSCCIIQQLFCIKNKYGGNKNKLQIVYLYDMLVINVGADSISARVAITHKETEG